MAIDPRKLRPSMLMRMLNSTPLEEVLKEWRLHRHRNRAGFRIGTNEHVDLFRYAAWLVLLRHAPEEPPKNYEAIKERAWARSAELSAIGRDIGDIPEVADPQRKEKACADFRYFCESYFPATFCLPWSDDHLKVIAKIEQAVLHGGLFAMAMPRGSGKTSLAETACIWAMLTGAREFVCLIGSDTGHARSMLESIKVEFEINEQLLEDYPEAVFPSMPWSGFTIEPKASCVTLSTLGSYGRPTRLSCRQYPIAKLRGRSSAWRASRAAFGV